MSRERYEAQVRLLVRAIPELAEENDFALKGGTAINLFLRDLPRLSVDIDLVYLPITDRAASLAGVRAGLARVAERLRRAVGADVVASGNGTSLMVRVHPTSIKIEANPVLRGTVFEPELRGVSEAVEDRYGYAEMKVVSVPDLYAGKIAAALDRQHPRDLFDIRYLLANEGITDDIFTAFLVYLISHPRPPHELLAPNLLDMAKPYEGHFAGMTLEAVSLDELAVARATLVDEVARRSRLPAARSFLQSFYAGRPDWACLGLDVDAAALPAVRWKMVNLERLKHEQPVKYEEQLAALRTVLD